MLLAACFVAGVSVSRRSVAMFVFTSTCLVRIIIKIFHHVRFRIASRAAIPSKLSDFINLTRTPCVQSLYILFFIRIAIHWNLNYFRGIS
jgi:hypothetical protein